MEIKIASQPSYIDPKVQDLVGQQVYFTGQHQIGVNGVWYHKVGGIKFSENTQRFYCLKANEEVWVKNTDLDIFYEDALDLARGLLNGKYKDHEVPQLSHVTCVDRGTGGDALCIAVDTTDPYRTGIPKHWFGWHMVTYIVEDESCCLGS